MAAPSTSTRLKLHGIGAVADQDGLRPGRRDGGKIAILSATSTAPNQNDWIDLMKEELKKPEYAKLELVDTVYGDDDDTKSYNEAQGSVQEVS